MRRRSGIFQRLQEFILCWPGDENEQIGYDGNLIILPPRDEVAQIGRGYPYRYPSAVDGKGRPMPGTVAVKDQITETGAAGGYKKLFDAAELCAWLEDTRGDLFDRGFSIVMEADEVPLALKAGRPKWEKAKEEEARNYLMQELDRRKRWDARGIPAPPSSSEHKVRWALSHLAAAEAQRPMVSEAEIRRVLAGGLQPVAQAEAERAPEPEDTPDEAANPGPVDIWRRAQAVGITPTKPDLVGLLNGDEACAARLLAEIAAKEGEARPSA